MNYFECLISGTKSRFYTDDTRIETDDKSLKISDIMSMVMVGKERIRITWRSEKGRHSILLRVTSMPAERAYNMIASNQS